LPVASCIIMSLFTKERAIGMKLKLGQKKNAFSLLFVAGAAFAGVAYGAPSVKIESVAQRWPWNNKVDITYSIIDGQDVSVPKYYRLVFTANIDGKTYTIDGVHDVGASAATGTNTVTWTAPSGIKTDNFSVSAAMYTAEIPSGNDYMIVNLEDGTITYEGLLASQDASNARYNTDKYKGDFLVLRKVAAGGSYPTGHGNFPNHNSPKVWKTDRDYYIGIFAVTRTQYGKLGLDDPCNGHTVYDDSPLAYRPVEHISWNDLRTAIQPSDKIPAITVPDSGTFFQRLNFLTGNRFGFDLPTEVMSEIAEHAGTTTYYYWGDVISDDYDEYFVGKRKNPADPSKTVEYIMPVGSKKPNGWGLYDVLGNNKEWCLDDASRVNLADAPDPWTPADGDDSVAGSSRRMYANYGGSNAAIGDTWRISNRLAAKISNVYSHMAPSEPPTKADWIYGFRVAYIVK